MNKDHQPVMVNQVVQALNLQLGDLVVDATLGIGGHARILLEAIGPTGKLLGIERTTEGLDRAEHNLKPFKQQVVLVHDDFRNLNMLANRYGFSKVQGVLFDLGLASWQIDTGYKGLSFAKNEFLDMVLTTPTTDFTDIWTNNEQLLRIVKAWRFKTGAEFLQHAPQSTLKIIFQEFGDIKMAHSIAQKIVTYRAKYQIQTTNDLLVAIRSNNPQLLAPLFQSIRILVNDEFGALALGLQGAYRILESNGSITVITFHSGEDQVVKRIFNTFKKTGIIKKETPDRAEIAANRRSRSAKLRVFTKR